MRCLGLVVACVVLHQPLGCVLYLVILRVLWFVPPDLCEPALVPRSGCCLCWVVLPPSLISLLGDSDRVVVCGS